MTSRRSSVALIRFIVSGSLLVISSVLLWRASSTPSTVQSSVVEDATPSSLSHLCFERKLEDSQGYSESKCSVGYVPKGSQKSCKVCSKGKFSLPNWIACEHLLGCDHLRHEVTIGDELYGLPHWKYAAAEWKGYNVLFAQFNKVSKYTVDYTAIQSFSPSQYFLYPVGYCKEDRTFLFAVNTTFFGVATRLDEVFAKYPACNRCRVKFNLVLSFLQVLSRLHANNAVLCNGRILDNLASQFLVAKDFSLVLATLDNLQSDANGTVLCHKSEQAGDFAAPEQRWPYGSTKIFNPKEQPGSDRKADIWKVPDMASFLLTDSCTNVLDYLQAVHLLCKSKDPHKRPTADQLLMKYKSIQRLLFDDT